MAVRRAGAIILVLAAASFAACHPVMRRHHAGLRGHTWGENEDEPVTVATSLQCPETQGRLKRISIAADGRSCAYQGEGDQEVSLRLLALDGKTPEVALGVEEAALHDLVPVKSGGVAASTLVRPQPGNDKDAKGDDGDSANIDLPGIHISAEGDRAEVKVFGTDIKADGDRADIQTDIGSKGTTIHAGPGGAEIRAGSVGRHMAQMVYILAADAPGPTGYRAAGLLAKGPVTGPLLVAEFRSKSRRDDDGDNDLQSLIDRNLTPKDGNDD